MELKIYYDEGESKVGKKHFHHEYEIIFVVSGKSKFVFKDKVKTVSKNQCIVISNLEEHSVEIIEKPYCRYVITISKSFSAFTTSSNLTSMILTQRPFDFPYVFRFTPQITKDILKLIEKLTEELQVNDDYAVDYGAAILSEMMILIYRSDKGYFKSKEFNEDMNVIVNMQRYIYLNFNKKITLEKMEKMFYMNRYHISKKFKEITGYNFKKYIILIRLNAAKELLRESNLSVDRISYTVGYENTNVFIRTFKNYENCTPMEYRNNTSFEKTHE